MMMMKKYQLGSILDPNLLGNQCVPHKQLGSLLEVKLLYQVVPCKQLEANLLNQFALYKQPGSLLEVKAPRKQSSLGSPESGTILQMDMFDTSSDEFMCSDSDKVETPLPKRKPLAGRPGPKPYKSKGAAPTRNMKTPKRLSAKATKLGRFDNDDDTAYLRQVQQEEEVRNKHFAKEEKRLQLEYEAQRKQREADQLKVEQERTKKEKEKAAFILQQRKEREKAMVVLDQAKAKDTKRLQAVLKRTKSINSVVSIENVFGVGLVCFYF
eukprot:TRINITY_DN3959_c0_g1_i2.p1 TRINITY_DN3959_c0_g1~~TRINITY_DN3959_c0_g1_i2.p1  ORF type:complete len:268 (+),score=50.73 TRINITY_DN3959_c0_g1_i2:308-1111(+)